jgi:hypothetical protein
MIPMNKEPDHPELIFTLESLGGILGYTTPQLAKVVKDNAIPHQFQLFSRGTLAYTYKGACAIADAMTPTGKGQKVAMPPAEELVQTTSGKHLQGPVSISI